MVGELKWTREMQLMPFAQQDEEFETAAAQHHTALGCTAAAGQSGRQAVHNYCDARQRSMLMHSQVMHPTQQQRGPMTSKVSDQKPVKTNIVSISRKQNEIR